MNVGSISSVSNTELFKIISGYNVTKGTDNKELHGDVNSSSGLSNKKIYYNASLSCGTSSSVKSTNNTSLNTDKNHDTLELEFTSKCYDEFFSDDSMDIDVYMRFGKWEDDGTGVTEDTKSLAQQISSIGQRVDVAFKNGQLNQEDYDTLNSALNDYALNAYDELQTAYANQSASIEFNKMLNEGLFDGMDEADITSTFQEMRESSIKKATTSDEYTAGLSAFLTMIKKMRSEPNENNTTVAETNYQELSDTISDMQEKTLAKINSTLNEDTNNVNLSLDLIGLNLDVQA